MNINTAVACPECGQSATIDVDRKAGKLTVKCSECDHRKKHLLPYGESVIIG